MREVEPRVGKGSTVFILLTAIGCQVHLSRVGGRRGVGLGGGKVEGYFTRNAHWYIAIPRRRALDLHTD